MRPPLTLPASSPPLLPPPVNLSCFSLFSPLSRAPLPPHHSIFLFWGKERCSVEFNHKLAFMFQSGGMQDISSTYIQNTNHPQCALGTLFQPKNSVTISAYHCTIALCSIFYLMIHALIFQTWAEEILSAARGTTASQSALSAQLE